jgi:acetyl esterase
MKRRFSLPTSPSSTRRLAKQFSPLHNIHKNTPPTIVFLGTEDKLIPVATAEQYKQRMIDQGLRCDLHLYEGKGHGFFNFKHAEDYKATVAEMGRFLESLGYLAATPTPHGD